ncbi:MAG: hypothetical protein HN733_08450 [Gammaproteobacteria bacterium]|nr:hypothetical protein [Gammaproteobacteria bacterium]
MLKSIIMVTMLVTNLNITEEAYNNHLDYKVVDRGTIDKQLGTIWDADGMLDHSYLIMQPSSNQEVYLRFIECEETTNYKPVGTHGWNSTEILVQDPDQLAIDLENSEFDIIGMPYDLYPTPDAPRAMQVLGPSKEMVYLTRIIPEGSEFNLGGAESYVDRVFIMVVGGPSMEELQIFYRDKLKMPVTEASDWSIGVISTLNNLPDDTVYPLSLATFEKDFAIELDEYPSAMVPRELAKDHLPPSTAAVSFLVDSLDDAEVEWREEPTSVKAFPYNGRRVGVTIGPAGEWVELIEN